MELFKKRETISQNIAYMAIMAGINVIFVLLTAVLPPLMFLIIFVLPLTSAVVTLFCKKRYFPIYFVVTIGLCLLTTSAIYIFDTFFYVLPSLITGFVFGLLIEKRIPAIYIITISTILQYVITFLTFMVLDLLLPDLNFIAALLNIFGLGGFLYKEVFIHSFLYLLAAAQTVFTYAFLKKEVAKLGFEFNLEIKLFYIPTIVTILAIALSIGMIFAYIPLVYVFVFVCFPLVIYQIISLIYTLKKLYFILLGIYVVIEVAIFVPCFSLLPHPLGIVLITPLFLLVTITYFLHNLFLNRNKKM